MEVLAVFFLVLSAIVFIVGLIGRRFDYSLLNERSYVACCACILTPMAFLLFN